MMRGLLQRQTGRTDGGRKGDKARALKAKRPAETDA